MKSKLAQIILLCFIVFMLGGILASVKGSPDENISEIISEFESNSDYHVSGYISTDPFNEDNVNQFGKINGTIGNIVSNGINKGIDLLFQLVKKIVS